MSTCQALWLWPQSTPWSGYCWCSLIEIAVSQWPMASINTTWYYGVLCSHLYCHTTNLVEIAQIFEKSCNHVATHFEPKWLSWYPWPMLVIHDNEGKFTGFAFQQMLCLLNIEPVPTTKKNLQANAICKQMHQTVATMLKTLLLANPPQSHCQAALLVILFFPIFTIVFN